MKRILSLVLVFLLTVSFCINVSAAERIVAGKMLPIELGGNFVEKENYDVGGEAQSIIYTNEKYDYDFLYFHYAHNENYENIEEANQAYIEYVGENYITSFIDEVIYYTLGKLSKGRSEGNLLIETYINAKDVMFIHSRMDYEIIEYVVNEKNIVTGEKREKVFTEVYSTIKDKMQYLFIYNGKQEENEWAEFKKVIESIEFDKTEYDESVIKILVDGERVVPDSDPVIVNDRTLCPIRAVAEKLGYKVEWDGQSRTATIKNDLRDIQITIGEKYIKGIITEFSPLGLPSMRHIKEELDVPAQIINDRTYLPLRAVGEALGCKVDWDEVSRAVVIKSK